MLEAHFAAEEQLLAPPLARHLGDSHADLVRLRNEHVELQRLRASLRAEAEEAGQRRLLGLFAQQLEAHVRWEERELFPLAEATLTADEKRALGDQLPSRLSAPACSV
jgi:hemerythrin-like domain-containing protein